MKKLIYISLIFLYSLSNAGNYKLKPFYSFDSTNPLLLWGSHYGTGIGTILYDVVNYAHKTITGCKWQYDSDISQSVLYFDASGDYVSLGTSLLNGATEGTVIGMFKLKDGSPNGYYMIFAKCEDPDTAGKPFIYMLVRNVAGADYRKLAVNLADTSYTMGTGFTDKTVKDEDWHTYGATWGNGELMLVLDNELIGSDTAGGSPVLSNNANFYIGHMGSRSYDHYGWQTQTRIYQRKMSVAEIVQECESLTEVRQ